MKWYNHLKTINKHKWMVLKYCFRCGLYKQGLLHDLSKYSYTEFSVGAKYYQGDSSPNNAEREEKGYTSAWLHHKGRNRHHLEYWIDYNLDREGPPLTGGPMPTEYVVEMLCDRMAASKNYNPKTYTDSAALDYYLKGRERYLLHPKTKELLEMLLYKLAEEGEDATFIYIRKELLKNKR